METEFNKKIEQMMQQVQLLTLAVQASPSQQVMVPNSATSSSSSASQQPGMPSLQADQKVGTAPPVGAFQPVGAPPTGTPVVVTPRVIIPKISVKESSIKLNSENWYLWNAEFMGFLEIYGPEVRDHIINETSVWAQPEWKTELSKIAYFMNRSVDTELKTLIMNQPPGDPRALYQFLHKTFVKKNDTTRRILTESFMHAKLDDPRDVHKWSEELRSKAIRINAMGGNITPGMLADQLLNGLAAHTSFENVTMLFDLTDDKLDFDAIVMKISNLVERYPGKFGLNDNDSVRYSNARGRGGYNNNNNNRNGYNNNYANNNNYGRGGNVSQRGAGGDNHRGGNNGRGRGRGNGNTDDKNKGECYNCGSGDHFAYDCPKPSTKCKECNWRRGQHKPSCSKAAKGGAAKDQHKANKTEARAKARATTAKASGPLAAATVGATRRDQEATTDRSAPAWPR